MKLWLGAIAAGVLLSATVANAHGAPDPSEEWIRLLADHNDDCGGDDSGSLANCQGTHDLIALDVREIQHSEGPALLFRLYLNGGDAAAGLKDTVSFRTGNVARSFDVLTRDNQGFTGRGTIAVGAARTIGDGTRFTVDATILASSIQANAGATLSGYKVEAFKGSTTGDYMPGGYKSAVADVANPPQGTDKTDYVRGELKLQGPTMYARLQAPATATVSVDGETAVPFALTNPLAETKQAFEISATGENGVMVGFHAGSVAASSAPPTASVNLEGGASTTLHLILRGVDPSAQGTLVIHVATSLDGLTTAALAYRVLAAGETPPTPSLPDSSTVESGFAAHWNLIAILFGALATRRPA